MSDTTAAPSFASLHEADAATVTAPDGAHVRVLLALTGGSLALFELQPGQVSAAVVHRSVEELWYVLAGCGTMWRRDAAGELLTALEPGLCVSIPLGTAFQFRCDGGEALRVVAVTLPHWPGDGEAQPAAGPWRATAG